MGRKASTFKQADVVRAINAARRCHLEVVRTEIGSDGSIVLHHHENRSHLAVVDELEAWRAQRHARSA